MRIVKKLVHRWRWVIQFVLVGLILTFLIRSIRQNWDQVSAYPWNINYGILAISLLVLAGSILFWASIWCKILQSLGGHTNCKAGIRIYVLANFAKYVPGSIWGYVGRAYLGGKEKDSPSKVWLSSFVEVAVAIVASLIVFAGSLVFSPFVLPRYVFILVAASAVVSLLCLLPPIFNPISNCLLRRFCEPATVHMSLRDLAFFLGMAILTQVTVGFSFALFVLSLFPLPISAIPSVVGSWSFSGTAGLLMIIVPYGFGVREGILNLLLSTHLPAGVVTVVALGSRLWSMGGELLSGGVVLTSGWLDTHLSEKPDSLPTPPT